MINETFLQLYAQNLDKLKSEMMQYQAEENIWLVPHGITNSAGNLCLHLTGNLNAYIGVGLAKSNYERDREREFAAKDVPRTNLVNDIELTKNVVLSGIRRIEDSMLTKLFPIVIWDKPKTVRFTLTRLLAHFDYHLGQINYHRRMVER